MAKGTKAEPTKTAPEGTESNADAFGEKKAAPRFKRVEAVTVPTFSIPDNGDPVFIKFLGEIVTKPNIDIKTGKVKIDPETKKELEISVARVLDMTQDQTLESPMEVVLGVILVNDLQAKYPAGEYVGEVFEIRKTIIKGKRARAYQVFRMEQES